MTRPIPKLAVDLVARWEGCELKAYRDIVNVLTIGYGHTGPDVFEGQTISQIQARNLLRKDLADAGLKLAMRIGEVVHELSDAQYAALLSFVFNLGASPDWKIWKVLRARKFEEVPPQLMRFVNAGGKRVQGLVNRRTDEVKTWHIGDRDLDDDLPSSVTRTSPTPPTSTDSKPLAKSNSFMTTGAGAVGGISATGVLVKEQLEPYSYYSDAIMKIVLGIVIFTTVCTLGSLLFQWVRKRNAKL